MFTDGRIDSLGHHLEQFKFNEQTRQSDLRASRSTCGKAMLLLTSVEYTQGV